jgi:hypothetical protein
MHEPTTDEFLADAIACVALDLLERLADAPEARSRFLLDLLGLMARHGGGDATEALRGTDH